MKAHQFLSAGVVLGLLVASCHTYSGTRTARIVGGEELTKATYPWMVSLQTEKEGSHFCGASLISDRWVLSASHCHEGEPIESLFAVVGEHDLNAQDPGQQRVGIKRIVKADSAPNGDMMLLELKEPVKNATVLLPDDSLMQKLKVGDMLTVMGWGNRSAGQSEDFPVKLHQVNVPLYDKQACKTAYSALGENVDDTMICAGYPQGGKDSCQGDSGGPLVFQREGKWFQAGVVSFGEGCAQANYPGVYTRVATFNRWIREQMLKADGLSINETNLGKVGAGSELIRPLTLTNNSASKLAVQGMVLQGDAGYEIRSETCTAKVLESKKSCTVELKTTFSDVGAPRTKLKVSTSDSKHPQWEYDISAQVLPKAGFSDQFGGELGWYMGELGQWALDSNSQELTSELNNQFSQTLLMTHIVDEGTLNFQWQVDNMNETVMLLLVDGKVIESFNATESFSTVTHKLPAGNHRIEWVFQPNGSRAAVGRSSDYKARIKSVRFDKAGSSAPKASGTTSGGGSGGGSTSSLLPLMVLLMLVRNKVRIHPVSSTKTLNV